MQRVKIIGLLVLLALLAVYHFGFADKGALVAGYDSSLFFPLQQFRGSLFREVSFSVGDVIYVLAGIWLLITVFRWVRYLRRYSVYQERLGWSVVSALLSVLVGYCWFVLGWGINYYRAPLRVSWHLTRDTSRQARIMAIEAYDSFLVDKMNAYAPGFKHRSLQSVNDCSERFYSRYTDSKVRECGTGVKESLFGTWLPRLDVGGYYNPFTGEGQVNDDQPDFMLPFNVCHEMAHQVGIAAEGDANLLAYAVCTDCTDSSFLYSGYFNLWLYTFYKLQYVDSAMAHRLHGRLCPLVLAHIDTLEQYGSKYYSDISLVSMALYDNYLKMQDQHDGIRSYGSVSGNAWQWEQQRMIYPGPVLIHIP